MKRTSKVFKNISSTEVQFSLTMGDLEVKKVTPYICPNTQPPSLVEILVEDSAINVTWAPHTHALESGLLLGRILFCWNCLSFATTDMHWEEEEYSNPHSNFNLLTTEAGYPGNFPIFQLVWLLIIWNTKYPCWYLLIYQLHQFGVHCVLVTMTSSKLFYNFCLSASFWRGLVSLSKWMSEIWVFLDLFRVLLGCAFDDSFC